MPAHLSRLPFFCCPAGQTKPTRVVRLLAEDSVERQVLEVRHKKYLWSIGDWGGRQPSCAFNLCWLQPSCTFGPCWLLPAL